MHEQSGMDDTSPLNRGSSHLVESSDKVPVLLQKPFFDKIEVRALPPPMTRDEFLNKGHSSVLLDATVCVLEAMKRGELSFSYDNIDDPLPMFVRFTPPALEDLGGDLEG